MLASVLGGSGVLFFSVTILHVCQAMGQYIVSLDLSE